MLEVKGNGHMVAREIKVSSFIRLHLSGKGLIELYPSSEEKVVIETDENLQEYFNAQNSGRTLYVSAVSMLRTIVPSICIIKVFIRQLDTLYIRNEHADTVCPQEINLPYPIEIKVQSLGNTQLNIVAPSIRILNQSVGDLSIKGKCGALQIKNQSEGNFDSTAMIADEVSIKNMAEGNVELFATHLITINHFGEGHVHYAGNAVVKDVKQCGKGEIIHI